MLESTSFILEVYLVERQALIGDYRYVFGPLMFPVGIERCSGSEGAFELLQVGQGFRVRYINAEGMRIPIAVSGIRDEKVELH